MSTTKTPTIDFEEDSRFELGDTHLTYSQIAAATGLTRSTIATYAVRGPLSECTLYQRATK